MDSRYIFVTVMQGSSGCVRVPTTANAVPNPGLMKDFNGANTCSVCAASTTPCPESSISGMISDGTAGAGGLMSALAAAGSIQMLKASTRLLGSIILDRRTLPEM